MDWTYNNWFLKIEHIFERNKLSMEILMEEFKPIWGLESENDELEFRDMSELKALLPPLDYQDSTSKNEPYFKVFRNEQSASNMKLSRLTPWWK